MATREELIQQAQSKFQREQLVQAAQVKWQSENMPQAAPEPPMAEQVETAARSALEGATFGVSEPVISGVNAVIGNAIAAGFDAEGLKDFLSKSVDTARIQEEFKRDVERRRKLEKELPGIAAAGEIAGGVASLALPVGAVGAIGKGVTAVGKGAVSGAARLAAPLAEVTKVAEVAPGAVKFGQRVAEAVSTGVAGEALKQAAEVPTGFIKPEERVPLSDVATSAAAVATALEGIPVVGRAIKAGGAKALSAVGGVKEQTIKDYLQRKEPFLPLTTEALKEDVDNAVTKVRDILAEQKKQAADELSVALGVLKDKMIKGSEESFEILEKDAIESAKKGQRKVIKASSILDEIDRQIAQQRSKTGDVLINEVREQVSGKLQNLKDRYQQLFNKIGEDVELTTGKELVKSLDEITEFAKAEGSFSSRLDQSLQSIRGSINKQLRDKSPDYAKKMDEVSKDRRLLDVASSLFGEEKSALSNLQSLAVGLDPRLNKVVKDLQERTAVDISKGIKAVKTTKPIERLTPENTQAFLKGVMSGRSIEGKKNLQLLSELADEDLEALAQRAAMTAEFEKIVQNGSRDVVFWKEVLGSMAPAALAGTAVGGTSGALVGAGVGYLVKTFGAPATKVILDGMIKVRGIPSVQKLNDALSDVTPKVRQDLINGFIRANTIGMEKDDPKVVQFQPDMVDQAAQDIKSSSLDSVTKAKAMQSLQQRGQIETSVVKRYMIGEQPKQKAAVPVPRPEQEAIKEDRPAILKALDKVKE